MGSLNDTVRGQPWDQTKVASFMSDNPLVVLTPGDTNHQMCELIHPGLSCQSHYGDYFLRHMTGFSLRFYLPLNIISTLIFNRKRLVEQPKETAIKVTKSVLRSATFLSLYCANAFAMQCFARRIGV